MKKLIFSTLLCCLILSFSYAQTTIERQVLGTTGNYVETGTHLVSSTVGEVVTADYVSGTFQLTQGFQQTDLNLTDVKDPAFSVGYKLFPNPSPGNTTLELEMPQAANLNFVVIDISGKTIESIEQEVQQGFFSYTFELENIVAGTYFIQIHDKKEGLLETIKFISIK